MSSSQSLIDEGDVIEELTLSRAIVYKKGTEYIAVGPITDITQKMNEMKQLNTPLMIYPLYTHTFPSTIKGDNAHIQCYLYKNPNPFPNNVYINGNYKHRVKSELKVTKELVEMYINAYRCGILLDNDINIFSYIPRNTSNKVYYNNLPDELLVNKNMFFPWEIVEFNLNKFALNEGDKKYLNLLVNIVAYNFKGNSELLKKSETTTEILIPNYTPNNWVSESDFDLNILKAVNKVFLSFENVKSVLHINKSILNDKFKLNFFINLDYGETFYLKYPNFDFYKKAIYFHETIHFHEMLSRTSSREILNMLSLYRTYKLDDKIFKIEHSDLSVLLDDMIIKPLKSPKMSHNYLGENRFVLFVKTNDVENTSKFIKSYLSGKVVTMSNEPGLILSVTGPVVIIIAKNEPDEYTIKYDMEKSKGEKYEGEKYEELRSKLSQFDFSFDIGEFYDSIASCNKLDQLMVSLKILSTYDKISKEKFIEIFKRVSCKLIGKKSDDNSNSWESVIGVDDVIKEIKMSILNRNKYKEIYETLKLPKQSNILLYGPPGTGKTSIARAIANEASFNFTSIKSSDIFSRWVGESEKAVSNLFSKARESTPHILFFDEIDSILGSSNDEMSQDAQRTINVLLTEMDGLSSNDGVYVIGSTNKIELIPDAFLRPGRFDKKILVNLPNEEAREKILKHYIGEIPTSNIDLKKVAKNISGFSPADIKGLINRIKEVKAGEIAENGGDISISQADIEKSIEIVRKEFHGRAISQTRKNAVMPEIPTIKLDDIGGYKKVKKIIRSNFIYPIKHPEIYEKLNIKEYPGLILYGPSGTGKTTFAKAIATEAGMNFIQIKPSDILNPMHGQDIKTISRVFELARSSKPAIMYFDEMETLFASRSGFMTGGSDIVTQLLIEMDGVEGGEGIYYLGSTNLIEKLDPAVVRSGRFGIKIEVGLPDSDDRREIIDVYMRENTIINMEFKTEDLIALTYGMSGADIKEIFRRAKSILADRLVLGNNNLNISINEIRNIISEMKES